MDAVKYLRERASGNGCVALTRTEAEELVELIKKQTETLNNRGKFIAYVQTKYPEIIDEYLEF